MIGQLVDVEALAIAYLAGDAGIIAIAGEDKVSTALPPEVESDLPWLQVWRLPGSLVTDETHWLERSRLQFAAWAGSRGDALDLARLTCTALGNAAGTHEAGVVTAVDLESTPYWSPDPDTDTPRYLFTAALYVHPS